MRKPYLILFIAIALFLYGNNLSGQGVSINEDGSSADNSAILDIKSTDKGLLIPRLTLNDASTASPVSNPATGLMIYNINGSELLGSYFWDGSAWEKIYDSQNGVDTDWTINGNTNKPGGGSWSTFSDFRSKENIEDYNKSLTELLQINPVSFKYKSEFNWGMRPSRATIQG